MRGVLYYGTHTLIEHKQSLSSASFAVYRLVILIPLEYRVLSVSYWRHVELLMHLRSVFRTV